MINFGLRRRFHDLKYFEVGLFPMFLEFIMNLRTLLQNFVGKHQFNVILSCSKQISKQ